VEWESKTGSRRRVRKIRLSLGSSKLFCYNWLE